MKNALCLLATSALLSAIPTLLAAEQAPASAKAAEQPASQEAAPTTSTEAQASQAPLPLKPEEVAAIKARVAQWDKAFQEGNADQVIALTHPTLKSMFNTEKEFESALRKTVADFTQDVKVESLTNGEPSALYDSRHDLISFIPRTTVMLYKGQRVKAVGYLVAARYKNQSDTQDWVLVDSTGMRKTPALLRSIFPDLADNVPVPPNTIERLKSE